MKDCPIRILMVSYSLKAAGIETFVVNLYKNIDHRKIQFDFLVYGDKDKKEFFEDEVLKYGARIIKISGKKYYNHYFNEIYKRVQFYKYLKGNNYKIVHVNGSYGIHVLELIISYLNRIPIIIMHSHNSGITPNVKYRNLKFILHVMIKPLISVIATHYFACSKKAAQWMYTKKLIHLNKVKIINNAIDIPKYSYNEKVRSEFRTDLQVENNFIIGHIGRFDEQKNHSFIVDIFNEIYKRNKRSILIFIGEGKLKDEIQQKVNRLNLNKNVIFTGVTNKTEKYLQIMDVFVLPSFNEGLPVVGIEAQAAGLKCFFSDTITKELNVNGLIEYMSLKDDASIWANNILKYQFGYNRNSNLSEIFNTRYNMKFVSKQLENFYLKSYIK